MCVKSNADKNRIISRQGSTILTILTKYWPGLAGCMTAVPQYKQQKMQGYLPFFSYEGLLTTDDTD